MRKSGLSFFMVLPLAAALTVVGCDTDLQSPTAGETGVASATANTGAQNTSATGSLAKVGAQATRAPEVFTVPVAFTEFNPCTGADDDFFGTLTVRDHFFDLDEPDPVRHHFNTQLRFDLESNAGFSGFGVQTQVDNGTPELGAPDEEFSFTSIFNFNLSNDSGQRLKVHSVFHITIRNGVVVRSLVDEFSTTCVGTPN